MLTNNQKHFY